MTIPEGHGIACCCNDCLDMQVATVYDTFGDAAGLKQRLENDAFIRTKAAFWDSFMERWRTPNDNTPMEDARNMVYSVSELVAAYNLAGGGQLVGSPLEGPPEPDDAMAATGITVENPAVSSGCACRRVHTFFGLALSRDGCALSAVTPCTCLCHPENR